MSGFILRNFVAANREDPDPTDRLSLSGRYVSSFFASKSADQVKRNQALGLSVF